MNPKKRILFSFTGSYVLLERQLQSKQTNKQDAHEMEKLWSLTAGLLGMKGMWLLWGFFSNYCLRRSCYFFYEFFSLSLWMAIGQSTKRAMQDHKPHCWQPIQWAHIRIWLSMKRFKTGHFLGMFTLNNSFFGHFFFSHLHRIAINYFRVCFNYRFYEDVLTIRNKIMDNLLEHFDMSS